MFFAKSSTPSPSLCDAVARRDAVQTRVILSEAKNLSVRFTGFLVFWFLITDY